MSAEDIRTIRLEGSLTIYSAADSKPTLLDQLNPPGRLALDLSAVDEIDCAGLQLLVLAREEARRAGGELQLGECSETVHEALVLGGLVSFFATAEEADA